MSTFKAAKRNISKGKRMKLLKRFSYANVYGDERKQKAVLGGVPNVPINTKGSFAPLDNELEVITTHPLAGYAVKQGPFWIGFHDKVNNKYASAVKLRTGESMIVTAIGDVACTPTIIDKRTIQWLYPNGSWIREYATEKEIKEYIFQKAGQQIKFKYTLTGLTVTKDNDHVDIYRGTQKAFSIQRPYYCTVDGEFISYVPVSWQKVGDNWEVTYPAPASDCYIDPVLVFGEGVGYIGGDHKDTWLNEGALGRSEGGNVNLSIRNGAGNDLIVLMRFSLTGHIPTNAIINTSVLTLTTSALAAFNATLNLSRLVTDWGVSPIDEGITANPALAGQATFRRSFDFNGAGGDVVWAGGGNITALDYVAAENTIVIVNPTVVGTVFNIAIPIMTRLWVANYATNYGFCIVGAVADNNQTNFDSQESVTVAERPYLTIDYDIPVTPTPTVIPIARRNSHIAIHNSIGIK